MPIEIRKVGLHQWFPKLVVPPPGGGEKL